MTGERDIKILNRLVDALNDLEDAGGDAGVTASWCGHPSPSAVFKLGGLEVRRRSDADRDYVRWTVAEPEEKGA